MAIETVNSSSSLADVIDRILDKGVVIDVWVRVSLVGIELLVVEARIVLASVETYLKYAEAVGLTGLASVPRVPRTPGVAGVPGALGVPGVAGVSGVPSAPGVPGVQEYLWETTPIPSTGSYATGVSPAQPSTATRTDIVQGS